MLDGAGFLRLVENAALLLVLAYLYDLIARHIRRQTLSFKALTGVVLGGISLAVMLASWRMANGVIFDTRSVVLSVGTLFFGTIPGVIGGLIAAVYRISQGGSGAVMGVSVIAMSVAVGAAWRHWRHTATRDPGGWELYLFGLVVHALMLALTFTLPWPSPLSTLRHISFPVIVIYPVAAVLLGLLLVDQRRRRRSEEALRESEQRSGAIVAGLPGGLVHIFDREFRYVFNDGEGMRSLGLTNDELVGRTLTDVLGEQTAAVVEREYRRVLEGDTVRFEGEFDGRVFLVTAAPLRDAEGEVERILALSVDITDRRRAEDEVRRLNAELESRVRRRTAELEIANREMEAFAYSVAHDLRGPLRAVDGFTALIEEENATSLSAESRDSMARVRAAVARMATLIDGLLRLAGLSRSVMVVEGVDLSAMAADLFADLQRRDPERQVRTMVAPGITAHGDAGLLRDALANLLDNAWKFTRRAAEARIEFGAEQLDGQTVYVVRDNGAGFDQQYVNKLFQPFERLHDAADFEGIGIGLASVARIIDRHHGRVWAEGSDGGGATFFFTLGAAE